VVMPVAARDKSGVIAELTRHLTNRWGCDYAAVLAAVHEREAGGSTGIGFGVAIPHARAAGEPVRLFFLIVGPPASAGQHVKLLGRIAKLVRHEHVRHRLFAAATPAEFYNALLDAENAA